MADRNFIKRTAVMSLVAVAAWLAFTLLQQEPFERAENLYSRGEYVSAFALYEELARQGDARAQFAVSRIYEQGLGQNIFDMGLALGWLEESAVRGYALAQSRLGLFYYNGDVIEEDLRKAELWWGRAADQNVFEAWVRLVRLYPLQEGAASRVKKLWHMGENIPRLRDLADRGEGFALVLLGNFQMLGVGMDKNLDEAARLLRLAVVMGNANAQYSLAQLILGTEGEDNEALVLLHLAADQGQVQAQLDLAALYAGGESPVDRDPEQALFWTVVALQRAAHMVTNADELISERSRGLDSEVISVIRDSARDWRPTNQPPRTRAAGDLWKP